MTSDHQSNPTAHLVGAGARAFDRHSGPLTFQQHAGSDDVYLRTSPDGNVLIVIPGLWTTMPDPLLAALRARRTANVTGRCPACEGVVAIAQGRVEHEHFCTAADDLVRPMMESWISKVGLYARGRRLVENPEPAGSTGA